jgi:N-acetylglucosaminyldiphosphoundecaprenol N-acetyl-beta-D-mannosaminyltransferase
LCRSVVTPNVDHVVRFQREERFRQAYREASLVVADGLPLVWASRICGKPLPQRVAGSDLVPAVFEALEKSRRARVFLLGGAPGVAQRAAEKMALRWPSLQVVGTCSPPCGFEHDRRMNAEILDQISGARPDLLLIGLGAPKQEVWLNQQRTRIEAPVAMCVGATIDFLAGHKRRSPVWMRHVGLEWAYRLACEPRRLARRYAVDAWVFPRLVWRDLQEKWSPARVSAAAGGCSKTPRVVE